MTRLGTVLFMLAVVVSPPAAHAQDARSRVRAELAQTVGESFAGRGDGTRTFGSGLTSLAVAGIHFTGFELSYPDLWDTDESGARSCAIPKCILVAPVQLPAGALITKIELNAYDVHVLNDVKVTLKQLPVSGAPPIVLATAQSEGLQGYTFVTTVLPTPHTVDNANNTYSLTFVGADNDNPAGLVTDPVTKVQAVRIFYKLQTSPGPAVATFNDVPTTHAFFPSVEALVAAGITAGCGPQLFCPDGLVTRGQMAAFLSRALGLHFAP